MSHIFTQFITSTYRDAYQCTVQEVHLQSEWMWAAVDFTRTLDHVVDYTELLNHISLYQTTRPYKVVRRILSDYMRTRFPALAH